MSTHLRGVRLHPFLTTVILATAGLLLGPAPGMGLRAEAAPEAGDYLVIDLSAGPSATAYPWSRRAEPPPGGWSLEDRTEHLVLRRLPAGQFLMGSPPEELGRGTDETRRTVTLTQSFYLGVFEVTQRQWELVMGTRPSYFANPDHYAARPVEKVSEYDIRENTGGDDPAVRWPANDHVHPSSFVGRLRARTGLTGLDLPTEAQWEYACRAGTTTALNSGTNLADPYRDDTLVRLGRHANNGGRDPVALGDPSSGTAQAGTYLPNAWGLYDLHGNVWERCLDGYVAEWGSEPASDPQGVDQPAGDLHTMRGGGFSSNPQKCRSAVRYAKHPGVRSRDYGFRLACRLSDALTRTPYQNWAEVALAGLAAGLREPGADPDADGWPNLAEYAQGLDPARPQSAGAPIVWSAPADLGGPARLHVRVRGSDPALRTTLHCTGDLRQWRQAELQWDGTAWRSDDPLLPIQAAQTADGIWWDLTLQPDLSSLPVLCRLGFSLNP